MDGAIQATLVGGDPAAIERALGALLDVPVVTRTVPRVVDLGEGKPRRYRSAVDDASGRTLAG